MSSRTIVKFHYVGNVWPTVEKWANENGYRQKDAVESERTYQKGVGFLVAPMMLKIKIESQETIMEAWIRVNFFARLMALFIVPSEMGIQSGGFRLAAPRSMARKAVNKLLAQLGQAPIA
jgi:hypothetical protein